MDHDEGFVVEVLPGETPQSGEAMAGGRGEHHGRFLEVAGVQFGEADWRTEQTDIQGIQAQALELLDGSEFVQGELDTGEFLAIAAQCAGEPAGGGWREDADAQGADEAVLDIADALLGAFDSHEDFARFVQKNAAGRGELDGAGGTFEQLQAEFVLEGFDLNAERGLGKMQALGSAPEVQFLRHGDEIAQMSQFHD